MKTSRIKMTGIILVIATISITSLSAQDFFYDKKEVEGKVVESIKYVLGDAGIYEKQIKDEFSYDKTGRLVCKKTYKWNGIKENWVPQDRVDQQYNDAAGTFEVSYSTWNSRKKEFDTPLEKATYQIDIEMSTAQK